MWKCATCGHEAPWPRDHACAEFAGLPGEEALIELFAMADALLRRGATHIEIIGYTFKADFPPAQARPVAASDAAPAEPPQRPLVDAGGGVMVDPDLLGHEVT